MLTSRTMNPVVNKPSPVIPTNQKVNPRIKVVVVL